MRILQLLLVGMPGMLWGSSDDYVNFIRQVQQDTGIEWDVSVSSAGEQ